MLTLQPQTNHYFTVERATGLIPAFEAHIKRIRAHRASAQRVAAQLESVGISVFSGTALPEVEGPPDVVKKLDSIRRYLSGIRAEIEQIASYGCALKDVDRGLIDLPSRRDGRAVFLCWQSGELAISHWHEIDAGFSGRRAIDAPSDFVGALLN
ncbi:MAG: DUF2203 domain-containing protein [Deltaproteobacteria bacterium]|nr:DUF2203 domain-containing protein [Deltaproteobacteria bacterium]